MGPLLDTLYEDTKKKVHEYIGFFDADQLITMSMDGWQSPTGEHIRNYMWVSDEATFFFDATNAGAVRPTAANIGAEAIKMIEATGPDNIAGITSDNATAETTSWDVVRDAFPKILATGCSAHAGSLLFKDCCLHAWSTKLINKSVKVAKFFKHHQYTNAEVRRRTREAGQTLAIILHGATRFAGVYYCMKRLLKIRTILKEIAASAGFEDRNFPDADDIINILNDAAFWKDLELLRVFMKPLKCFIKLTDHDCHVTHHVYPGMWVVNDEWSRNDHVPSAFQKHALKELRKRWEWLTFPVHYITYGLSPSHHNDNIFTNKKVMDGLKEVIKFYAYNNQDYQLALREFTAFKNYRDEECFPTDAKGDIIINMSPKSWWQIHGAMWPTLQPIATRVFSVGTSSSASERNFSTWSHIWSNRANSLSFERAIKMVYVYTNLRTLQHIRSGTQRKSNVESNWLATEIETDED